MGIGPLGRGGARRRTRRRMRRRTSMMTSMESQQAQQQTNKNPSQMSETELNAPSGQTGIQPKAKASESDIEQLEKLADLKEKGVLTEKEFENQKKKILAQ